MTATSRRQMEGRVDDLLSLAERVEAATAEQQRKLLIEAFEAIKGPRRMSPRAGVSRWHADWFAFEKMLNADAFESAAMSLVPEGCQYTIEQDGCWLRWPDESDETGIRTVSSVLLRRGGKCTPLAICAAALRARAAQNPVRED